MYTQSLLFSTLVLFFTPAASWGGIGHRTVGYLALQYMTPEATQFFNGIIEPSSSFDVSDAAVWADSHRSGAMAYTYNWHFIDARDDPPNACSVNFQRDCDARDDCASNKSPGCVVGAIANMTSQLTDPDLVASQLCDPMKFLLHFVGDSHQPLHAENLDVGGNTICVMWNGETQHQNEHAHSHRSDDHSDRIIERSEGINSPYSDPGCPKMPKCINLHATWDTLMIEKLLDYQQPEERNQITAAEKAAAQQWASLLFADPVGNPDLPADDCVPTGGSADDALDCALRWATEANNFVCSYVLKDGVDGVANHELSGDYYDGAVPVIKHQISRAARRFAATLNAMALTSGAGEHQDDGQRVMEDL